MKLLYENFIKTATFEPQNFTADSLFPFSNLYNRFLEKKIQVTGTGPFELWIRLPEDKTISSIGYGFHNLSSFSFELLDSGESNVFGPQAVEVTYDTTMYHFTATSCRIIKIIFQSSEAQAFIGGFSAAAPISIDNWNVNPRFDKVDKDKTTATNGGQTTGVKTKKVWRYRATVSDLDTTKKKELEDMIDEVGSVDPIYFDFYDDSHEVYRPIHCLFQGDGHFVKESESYIWSTTLVFKETR